MSSKRCKKNCTENWRRSIHVANVSTGIAACTPPMSAPRTQRSGGKYLVQRMYFGHSVQCEIDSGSRVRHVSTGRDVARAEAHSRLYREHPSAIGS
eukprot:1998171-Rhodomonas_salina.1